MALLLSLGAAWGSYTTFAASAACYGSCRRNVALLHTLPLACGVLLAVSALLLVLGAVLIFVQKVPGAVLTGLGALLPLVPVVLFFAIADIRDYVIEFGLDLPIIVIGAFALATFTLSVLSPTLAFLRYRPPAFPPPPGYGPR
ncbi:hypothetical protein [Actinokineospora bangkokensis]|uniref:hypothetical protein n=1 Tax=Actinokineospora bangkokensis TaxID=1193682 RepID=UPI00117737F0|nr:hypothetical protein [Actinokineospora bangkokensis]